MKDYKTLIKLGENIKSTRTKQNISNEELERKCQLKKGAIAKIESGKYDLRIITLFKISVTLGININKLV
jgi:transcriptional regulator with XRE-family HTH domain